jgi:hypothetical protein
MRQVAVYIALFLLFGAGQVYAAASLPADKAKKSPGDKIEAEKKIAGDFESTRKLVYEKMIKRTNEYKDELDNVFFLLNNLYRQAVDKKDAVKQRDMVAVMTDYNSVIGDIGLMQVILDLGKLCESSRFMDYYMAMENAFERLRGSFSLKNEMFLNRVDNGLKNPDALRYEKQLCRIYRIILSTTRRWIK